MVSVVQWDANSDALIVLVRRFCRICDTFAHRTEGNGDQTAIEVESYMYAVIASKKPGMLDME